MNLRTHITSIHLPIKEIECATRQVNRPDWQQEVNNDLLQMERNLQEHIPFTVIMNRLHSWLHYLEDAEQEKTLLDAVTNKVIPSCAVPKESNADRLEAFALGYEPVQHTSLLTERLRAVTFMMLQYGEVFTERQLFIREMVYNIDRRLLNVPITLRDNGTNQLNIQECTIDEERLIEQYNLTQAQIEQATLALRYEINALLLASGNTTLRDLRTWYSNLTHHEQEIGYGYAERGCIQAAELVEADAKNTENALYHANLQAYALQQNKWGGLHTFDCDEFGRAISWAEFEDANKAQAVLFDYATHLFEECTHLDAEFENEGEDEV